MNNQILALPCRTLLNNPLQAIASLRWKAEPPSLAGSLHIQRPGLQARSLDWSQWLLALLNGGCVWVALGPAGQLTSKSGLAGPHVAATHSSASDLATVRL